MGRVDKALFVGGSRSVSGLDQEVVSTVLEGIRDGCTFLIGDSKGCDRLVQQYLASQRYGNVVVFGAEGECRENLGNWKTEVIAQISTRSCLESHGVKDRKMARLASAGLMVWDGKSHGTLASIEYLVSMRKPVFVYLVPARWAYVVRNPSDLDALLNDVGGLELPDSDQTQTPG